MFNTVSALLVVIGIIVILRALMIRFGLAHASNVVAKEIRILETTTLGAKQKLHLVEVDGQRLLIGSHDAGIARLARLPAKPAQPEVDASAPDAGTSRTRRPGWIGLVSGTLGVAPMLLVAVALLLAPMAGAQQVDPTTPTAISGSAASPAGTSTASTSASPTFSVSIDGATAPDKLSDTLKIVLVLTAISIAPSILLMATCFTRILIVLSLLRQAIGTATLPPNQVLVGLALMTTIYVMTPVGEVVYADSLGPYMAEEIGGEEAVEKGLAPVRDFLLSHTREDDLLLFTEMKGAPPPDEPGDVALSVLMPAYMISEIRTAFEIGFMIYLPFLVVDLVIASMLISLGMIMLPPVMIALPFKLMLFVLVDGWNLTLTALVSGLQ